jgi:hypothetical protein
MRHERRFGLRCAVGIVAVFAMMSCFALPAAGAAAPGGSEVDVYPPGAHPYGRSLGEWTASWWQWAISMPISANPLMETADCNAGQGGPVWFLGGSFVNATITRECTIPAGVSILAPVLNAECSTVEAPPFYGGDETELRDCVRAFMDLGTAMSATLDGEVIDLGPYRVQSPMFGFSAPADNVLFVPGPVSGQSVSDGVWVFLPPLSAGQHTIHIGGSIPDFNFTLDVTYILTVRPGGRGRGQLAAENEAWGRVKQLYR